MGDDPTGQIALAEPGEGEMAARVRDHLWDATPLGSRAQWPQSLRTAVDLALGCDFPMLVLWGPELVQIYNDAYRSIMAGDHPAGLGRPARECRAELWHLNEPIFARVRAGETVNVEDALHPISRHGYLENAWLTLCYSPLRDESGAVAGVLVTAFETTGRMEAETERERLMAEVEQQANELDTIISTMVDPMLVYDAAGRVVRHNPAADALVGANPRLEAAALERGPAALQQMDGRSVSNDEMPLTRVLQGATVTGERYLYTNASGRRYVISVSAAPLKDGKEIQGAVAVWHDSTALYRTEEALRESEARLRRAMEIETVGVIFFKATGEITFANDAFLRMSGYSHADAEQGLVRWDVMTPKEFMPQSLEAVSQFERFGRTVPYEKQYIRKDGSRWWALFAATRIGPDEGVEFVLDVTERKQQQEGLGRVREELEVRVAERTAQLAAAVEDVRTREERLRLLLEQMPAMLWTTDRAMRVTTLAGTSVPAWHAAHPPSEGESVAELFTGTELDGNAEDLHQGVLDGTPATFEFRVDGHTYEAHVEALRSAGGEVIGTISLAHDVTERTLRKVQEDFIASVSHELQTPLTSVRAGLGLLEAAVGETLGTAEAELLAASRRNVERLRLQIAQLLTANRVMVEERAEVDRSAIDLHALVEGAVDAVRPLLQEKEQGVTVDMPDRLEVEGDRQLMEQVLANLLSNAYRHTPHGTRIVVSSWLAGDQVRLAVHDTGPGIPADELESIFRRFFRAPGSQREGIGLGLAMARSAVEAQGGRLWAESSPGRGATFIVALPRAGRVDAS